MNAETLIHTKLCIVYISRQTNNIHPVWFEKNKNSATKNCSLVNRASERICANNEKISVVNTKHI